MATTTTRLLLRKPDPNPTTGDFIDVVADINNGADKIDAVVGYTVCTSGTRPTGTDRWDGRPIYETDTKRTYMWSTTEATWLPLLNGRGSSGPYLLGASTDTSGDGINIQSTAAGNDVWRSRVAADANPRFSIDADGTLQWGPGSAALNVNLYWGTTDQLKTDDAFLASTLTATTIVNGTTDVQRGGASLGRGQLFRGKRSAAKTGMAGTETGVVRLNATLLANRSFIIASHGGISSTVNEAAQTASLLRFNAAGANAGTGDAQMSACFAATMAGSGAGSYFVQALYTSGGSNVTMSILLTARRIAGTGTLSMTSPDGTGPEIWIFDVGPSITQTGVDI